jgi:hypothetical protein
LWVLGAPCLSEAFWSGAVSTACSILKKLFELGTIL